MLILLHPCSLKTPCNCHVLHWFLLKQNPFGSLLTGELDNRVEISDRKIPSIGARMFENVLERFQIGAN